MNTQYYDRTLNRSKNNRIEQNQVQKEVGSMFGKVRNCMNLVPGEVAEQIGVSRPTVVKFENGMPIQRPGLVQRSYELGLKTWILENEFPHIPKSRKKALLRWFSEKEKHLKIRVAGQEDEFAVIDQRSREIRWKLDYDEHHYFQFPSEWYEAANKRNASRKVLAACSFLKQVVSQSL